MTIDIDNKLNKKLLNIKSSKVKSLKSSRTQKSAKSELGFLTANVKKVFFRLKQAFTKALVFRYFDTE